MSHFRVFLKKFIVLFFEVQDDRIKRIPIDNRLILYLHSSASIYHSIKRFVLVAGGWTNTSDHKGIRVTSKRILQDPSQFRVSVRNMLLGVCFLLICER